MATGGNGAFAKALGVAGLVIGVIGGAIGLAATLGPTKEIAKHESRLLRVEADGQQLNMSLATHAAAQTEQMNSINEKLDKLLRKAGL
jgi:hypothetical protein